MDVGVSRAPDRGQADQAAAAKISAPPISVRGVSVAAPSATDDRLANTISDSITSAVVCAGRRDAPYCSDRLAARKPAFEPQS